MSLRAVEGPAGAPWERPMHGTLDRLVVESELLAGNPLGDPARRPLYVYRPPGVEPDHPRPLPSVYVIQGYTGQLDNWFRRDDAPQRIAVVLPDSGERYVSTPFFAPEAVGAAR